MWGTDPLKSKRECLFIISYKFITLFVVLCSLSVYTLSIFNLLNLSIRVSFTVRMDKDKNFMKVRFYL